MQERRFFRRTIQNLPLKRIYSIVVIVIAIIVVAINVFLDKRHGGPEQLNLVLLNNFFAGTLGANARGRYDLDRQLQHPQVVAVTIVVVVAVIFINL